MTSYKFKVKQGDMQIDTLIEDLKERFIDMDKPRANNSTYEVSNILMCGFALFSVKDSSLFKFVHKLKDRASNLKNVYHITQLPSDTTIRTLLDEVSSEELKPLFKPYLEELDNQGVLDNYEYIDDALLVPIDGVQYFSSKKVGCTKCSTKQHKDGSVTYHHNALAAVVMRPGRSEVFPVTIEDIIKQDGKVKNDCELAAAQRLIPNIRKNLPDKKIIIGGDALYANGPFVKLLQAPQHDMRFILSVKPGSQEYLFLQFERLEKAGKIKTFTRTTKDKKCITKYANELIINGSNPDIKVNFLHFEEHDLKTGKVTIFNWITDITINAHNYPKLVKAGRGRWKIENETFNTLKNQGYNYEHNFGHGKKYLATNFSILMLIAFLFDQIQQYTNKTFRLARTAAGSKTALWEEIRKIFDLVVVDSMQTIYKIIAKELKLKIQIVI